MPRHPDVVIVGGAVHGASAAYHLAAHKGFDGSVLAEMLTPALTTVHRPLGDMAQLATTWLIRIKHNGCCMILTQSIGWRACLAKPGWPG